MASNPAKTNETIVDPAFYIPDGVVEMHYDDSDVIGSDNGFAGDDQEDVFVEFDGDIYIVDDDSIDSDEFLEVPDNFTIISQTIRTAPGGTQVIDLVAEVDDVAGDVTYEYRITKV